MNKNSKMFSLEENACYYKKEYEREKTKLEFIIGCNVMVGLAVIFVIGIMR